METISTGSFSNCRKLTRIVLPESTKLIEDNAMEFDNDLLAIDILAGHAPKAGQYAFGSFARNAQLRIMPGSKATYLPGLYDGVEPIMPEELVELTSATAALANNTEATVQMYKKCTEIYLAAVENYNNYLIAYKEATEYYTLEEATMPEYDKKLAACTAVKNQYYAKLKEYQIEFANYRTEAETVEAASSIDAGAELADAYKQCTQAEKDLNQLVKECTNYYKDANAKYKTTYEVYKAELSESQEYDGYKFFKPENIKETNFEIK